MPETLREEVCRLQLELPKNDLVAWTTGKLSARDPGTGSVAVKPSGVRYAGLAPQNLRVVDLDGNIVEGELKPSSDALNHLCIYRHRPDVGGTVHAHSTVATAFAAVGRPIPPYLTAICDEFGGTVPCGGMPKSAAWTLGAR